MDFLEQWERNVKALHVTPGIFISPKEQILTFNLGPLTYRPSPGATPVTWLDGFRFADENCVDLVGRDVRVFAKVKIGQLSDITNIAFAFRMNPSHFYRDFVYLRFYKSSGVNEVEYGYFTNGIQTTLVSGSFSDLGIPLDTWMELGFVVKKVDTHVRFEFYKDGVMLFTDERDLPGIPESGNLGLFSRDVFRFNVSYIRAYIDA